MRAGPKREIPVPPLWIGGQSTAALRRAVRFGVGWLSGVQTPREFAASAARLGELADEAGRTRPRLGHADGGVQGMYGLPADRARQLAIAGTPSQVARMLCSSTRTYVSVGAMGPTTRYLSEAEVAMAYRDRFAAAGAQTSRADEVERDLLARLVTDVVWVVVSLVPDLPG